MFVVIIMFSRKTFVASSKPVLASFIFLFVTLLHSTTIHALSPEQERDRITLLPGQPPVKFNQFSGYVTVNDEHGRALFYWLTEATSQPEKKPVIVWFNGGPGCSSLGYGAFEEIGPFRIDKNGQSLHLDNSSWNNVANLLFMESPAGVGFSYTNTSSDLNDTGDKRTSEDALTFLIRFLLKFPEYKQREFYLAGESYAGHYVPQLAEQIINYNKRTPNAIINLKGIMLGNAIIDKPNDSKGVMQFWYSHSMISERSYNSIMKSCEFKTENTTKECQDAIANASKEVGDVNQYNVYAPTCKTAKASPFGLKNTLLYSTMYGYDPCLASYAPKYLNKPDVQKAFHVHGIPKNWTGCSAQLNKNWQDSQFSMLSTYKTLIASGLRILIFSGDTDAVVSAGGTMASINQLNLTVKTPWYPWYAFGQVGGRAEVYNGGLTYTTVRGAGHEVPLFQPKRAFVMVQSFLQGKDLPKA